MLGPTPFSTVHLQTVGPFQGLSEIALTGYELLGALLGLFIAYQAYRGYRRNASRPMLFMAIGFALILGPPILILVVLVAVPSLPQATVQAVVQTFEIAGLISIIYALRMEA